MPEVIINGPAGRLECRYMPGATSDAPTALVLHPEPHKNGTMNNRVTFATYKLFQARGYAVMRFNFRGVGRSQGTFEQGDGELADAATAMDWLQAQNPNSNIFWIGGFSFGAWVAMQLLMRRPEIMGFVSISPPANNYDFSFLAPCTASGLIVQGSKDTIVPEEYPAKLADKLAAQKNIKIDYNVIEEADHFFRDQQEELNNLLTDYIYKRVAVDRDIVSKRRVGKRRRKSRKSKLNLEVNKA